MHISIIGLGYVGQHLVDRLSVLKKTPKVYSRRLTTQSNYQTLDLDQMTQPAITTADSTLFYTVPPNSQASNAQQDQRIRHLLTLLDAPPRHIIYYSTSGVYGDCQGRWIDEHQFPQPQNPRHYRRLDAEQQLSDYCHQHHVALTILRVGGIYGSGRLPLKMVEKQQSIIQPEQAPWINYIHIDDLIEVSYLCSQRTEGIEIYNVADGNPQPMGSLQRLLTQAIHHTEPPMIPFDEAYAQASPMLKTFMSSSKRLKIDKLRQQLNFQPHYSSVQQGVDAYVASRQRTS